MVVKEDNDIIKRIVIETTKRHKNLEDKNPIEIIFYRTGDIAFAERDDLSDGCNEAFLFFYKEQFAQLKKILSKL